MSIIYNLERAAPICRHCKTKMDWHSTHRVKEPKELVLDVYRCGECERMQVVTIQVEQVA